jgi:hypothetical protein
MDNFYLRIDTEVLKKFSPEVQTFLNKENSKNSSKKLKTTFFIRMCPYCDRLYLLWTPSLIKNDPKYCVLCGETTPIFKIRLSIEKAYALFKISSQFSSINKSEEDKRNQRILIEQCIVILATGIELFFKEMYIVGMDLKYVKNNETLFKKFYKDAKNEFINMGKINQKFDEDLHLNLKLIFGEDLFKELNILMLKRNVIVHNNGFADKTFKENSGIKCELSRPIPLSIRETKRNFKMVNTIVEKFQLEYGKLIAPDFINKIEYKLKQKVSKKQKLFWLC